MSDFGVNETERAMACVIALAGHDPREVEAWKRIENLVRKHIDWVGLDEGLASVELVLAELDAIRREAK